MLVAIGVAACGGSSKTATHPVVAKRPATAGPTRAATTTAAAASRIVPIQPIELYHPLSEYANYVEQRLHTLRPQLTALRTAAGEGDLATAKHDWLAAHTTWLEIGQDDAAYGAFGQLGQDIDGLPHGLHGTTASKQFTGFH